MVRPELISFGYQKTTPEHPQVNVLIPNYSLHFIQSGKGYFNGVHLKAGQGFLCRIRDVTDYRPDKDDPWTYAWMNFKEETTYEKLASVIKFSDNFTFSFDTDKPYFEIIKSATDRGEKYKHSQNTSYASSALFYEVLSFLTEDSHRNRSLGDNSIRLKHVEEAEKLINANCHDKDFTITALSEKLNMSRGYLRNLFAEYRGTSPQEYLQGLRLIRACELLSLTDEPIGMVAKSVGYNDALHFSKIFKKHYHLSPTDYKKRSAVYKMRRNAESMDNFEPKNQIKVKPT